MFHVDISRFIERCREEGFSELDLMELRVQLGAMQDRAAQRRAPPPPSMNATTLADAPKALVEARAEARRTGSSQRLRAVIESDPDDDE